MYPLYPLESYPSCWEAFILICHFHEEAAEIEVEALDNAVVTPFSTREALRFRVQVSVSGARASALQVYKTYIGPKVCL